MPQPLRVVHDTDPKQDILDDVGDLLNGWHIPPTAVLLVMYERGKQKGGGDVRLASGIIIPKGAPHGSLDEDKWQGKVGLVLKVGSVAFTDDEQHKWHDFKPVVGDWVVIGVGDTFSFDLPGDRRARLVDESNVRLIVPGPDLVW